MSNGWPIAIIQDRYMGTYSGGKWLAFTGAWNHMDEISNGAHGDDVSACAFDYDQSWLAIGDTPDEALDNLRKKL